MDYVGKVTVATELVEDDLMEVALELDVSDVKESEGAFEFIVPARGTKKKSILFTRIFQETSNLLTELEKQPKITVQNSELTYLAASPVEIDDEDFEAVDLFEEKLTTLLSSNDFAMELGNIYYNFEINE